MKLPISRPTKQRATQSQDGTSKLEGYLFSPVQHPAEVYMRLLIALATLLSLPALAGVEEAKAIIENKRERARKYVPRPVLSTKDTALLLKGTKRIGAAPQRLAGNEVVDNRSFDTGIRNQGSEGLCTSFAVSAALEFLGKKNERVFNLSEKHLWNTYRVYQTTNALNAATQNWITTEAAWPYAYARPVVSPLPKKANLLEYAQASTWDEVYGALQTKRGVVLSVVTNSSWSNPRGGVLSVGGQQQGGHAIAVSGYFDTNRGRYLIIKNSWGQNYGDLGYVYLPEAYCARYWCAFHIIGKAQVQ
jgi:C1A family cysteine protease